MCTGADRHARPRLGARAVALRRGGGLTARRRRPAAAAVVSSAVRSGPALRPRPAGAALRPLQHELLARRQRRPPPLRLLQRPARREHRVLVDRGARERRQRLSRRDADPLRGRDALPGDPSGQPHHQLGPPQVVAALAHRGRRPLGRVWRAAAVEVLHAREDDPGGHGAPEAPVVAGLPLDDQVAEVVRQRRGRGAVVHAVPDAVGPLHDAVGPGPVLEAGKRHAHPSTVGRGRNGFACSANPGGPPSREATAADGRDGRATPTAASRALPNRAAPRVL